MPKFQYRLPASTVTNAARRTAQKIGAMSKKARLECHLKSILNCQYHFTAGEHHTHKGSFNGFTSATR
jgi:hypothetical protein